MSAASADGSIHGCPVDEPLDDADRIRTGRMAMTSRRGAMLLGITLASLCIVPFRVAAQERTLDELKQEILLRAGQNRYPISEVKVEDVRLALGRLTSKDPDEWAQAWSRVAEPYEQQGEGDGEGDVGHL